MAYQLQITTSQGIQTLPLDRVANSIPADPSASYTLLDEQGNAVTENLSLTKDGNNLSLEVDGESVANIEEFYSVDSSQYVIDGSTVPAENMVISSAGVDASGSIIANGAVWQAESSFLGLSTLQLVGAGVGSAVALGAAVAAGSEEESKTEAADVFSITSSTTTTIDENSGAGENVYTVTSSDELATGEVTYSLSDDDVAAGVFTINASTGDVTLTLDPDYETTDEYSFTVIATDEEGTSAERTVTLGVNNLDEVAPTITSGTTATAIDEDSGANQVVYTVTATDDNTVTYSLSGDDASLFSIDSNTGEVTLIADPDHETQSSYSFDVVATDEAGNASTAQTVTLNVNDIDDAAPDITSGATATAIDENSGANQIVYTVTSTDTGDISTGNTSYSLSGNDASLFSINSNTGAVTLIANPDYETQSSYSFDVVATDEAGNESEQTITLNINDVDEAAPTNTFTDAAYDETSNTLTLTGTNMNTLLFGSESSSTDIKNNFNWDNLQWDFGSDGAGSIRFGPTDIDSVYVTDDNTLSIIVTVLSAAALESRPGFDDLTEDNSIEIVAGFSGDTAGFTSTTDAYVGEAAMDTSIVVFDLINNQSSSHSDRTFESGVSYSIYIIVSNDNSDLNLSPAFEWNAPNNLGSDDYIYLVSDGGVLLGENGNSLIKTTSNGFYATQSGDAVKVYGSGFVSRYTNSSRGVERIWDNGPTVQAGTVNGAYTLTALPEGVMTSQGLA